MAKKSNTQGRVLKQMLKNNTKMKRRARRNYTRGVNRSNADRVLAQGTGHVPVRPFGGIPRPMALHAGCWNAFHTAHAPLPRSVGPYTVVRTSFFTNTSAKCGIIGTFRRRGIAGAVAARVTTDSWSNCVMVTEEGGGAIGTTASTGFHFAPFPGGSTNASSADTTTFTCCPAAISVQTIGPKSIQVAEGQLAAAVIPARMDLMDDTRSWDDIQTLITSYFRPRLMSAGKLTLRGVQMDSHPLSMADISSFDPMLYDTPNPSFTGAGEIIGAWDVNGPYPCGWAPMAFVNPLGAEIQLLIGVEWRVRFDVGNPAVASHQHHGVSTDQHWDDQIRRATNALPGVIDIVEKVANTGLGIYRGAMAAGLL